jgi:hypothetical protein
MVAALTDRSVGATRLGRLTATAEVERAGRSVPAAFAAEGTFRFRIRAGLVQEVAT